MFDGYLKFTKDEAAGWPKFDLTLFLKHVKLEGLSSMNFVLEFYPKPYDENKQYTLWQLIQNLEDETIKLSMIERIDEGQGWDTAQSLNIVFDLTGKFEGGSHYFGYVGKSNTINDVDDLFDAYESWIHLGGLNKPTNISTNLEDE